MNRLKMSKFFLGTVFVAFLGGGLLFQARSNAQIESDPTFVRPRIGGVQVSYCTAGLGCSQASIKAAADAFCRYAGFSHARHQGYYRTGVRNRHPSYLYLGGDARNLGNWRYQSRKRRFLKDVQCVPSK